MLSPAKHLSKWLEGVLALLLGALLLLACTQIILRSGANTTLLWIDPMLRYLVLWSGFVGAILASLQGKHIAIDMSSLLLPKKYRGILAFAVSTVSALTCYGLLWASWLFIISEKEYGGAGLLGVASWIWNLIFPITFAAMSIIYTLEILATLLRPLFQSQPNG